MRATISRYAGSIGFTFGLLVLVVALFSSSIAAINVPYRTASLLLRILFLSDGCGPDCRAGIWYLAPITALISALLWGLLFKIIIWLETRLDSSYEKMTYR